MDAINAFMELIDKLIEAVTEKIPNFLKSAMELADKVVSLKDNAASEFDALDGFHKGMAIAKTVKLAT